MPATRRRLIRFPGVTKRGTTIARIRKSATKTYTADGILRPIAVRAEGLTLRPPLTPARWGLRPARGAPQLRYAHCARRLRDDIVPVTLRDRSRPPLRPSRRAASAR